MARVPTYDGPQVQSTALQTPMQGPIDASSGLRAAGQALGQVAGEIDKFQRREAETQANQVDSEITAGWLQWDAENRRKYQGQNVDQYQEEAAKWWDAAKSNYGKDMSPLAQQAIGTTLGRKRTQAMGSVFGHVNAEKDKFADVQAEAAAQAQIEWSIDTGDTVGGRARVLAIVGEKAQRKGWTTEMTQAENQRLLGTMHLAYVTALAEGNDKRSPNAEAAKAYYEKNKGEIPGSVQARVEQVLKAEGDNQFAKQTAAGMAGKPLSEQLSAAAEITDPARREKTLTEIRSNHAMVKAAQQEREAAASDNAWQMVGQGKRVPERVLSQMNGKERVQLQDHLRERAKQAAEGTSVKTDWAAYIEAREKLFSDDPAVRASVNLQALTTKVAGPQLEQLLDIKTKRGNAGKAVEVATSEQQLNAFLGQMDLKGDTKAQFQAAAYDRYNEHLKTKGKEPTFEERQAINDALAREVVTHKGMLWDTTKPAFQLPKDRRDAALAPADKFETGKVYRDKNGAQAKYLGGGKWEPLK